MIKSQTPAHIISGLEARMWFSTIRFMEQDLAFIKRLLTAPIFRQNVPNLFERLTKYLTKINELSEQVGSFINEVKTFKESLENYPEEDNPFIDDYYYGRYKLFMEDYIKLDTRFLELKSDVCDYVSGVLLTNKTV